MTNNERDIILKEVAKFLISTAETEGESSYRISSKSESELRKILEEVPIPTTGLDLVIRDLDNAGIPYKRTYDTDSKQLSISICDKKNRCYEVYPCDKTSVYIKFKSMQVHSAWDDAFRYLFDAYMLGKS